MLLFKQTQKQLLAGYESFAPWLFMQHSCDKALYNGNDYIFRHLLFVPLLQD